MSQHPAGVNRIIDPGGALSLPRIPAAKDAEAFALHRAALEWSLEAPITIRGEQDILSRANWEGRFDPFAHQVQNLITFCRRAPVTLLADDVGLGKTISAGLILSELMTRRKVGRALVVAPKILLPQWQEELAAKFNVAAVTASGSEITIAMRRQLPIVITTYQSAGRYLDDLRHANFDMVVLDEAHKLRNLHGTAKPPMFAVNLRRALADRVFKYVLMLTATPIQNRLWDLYSLVDLLTVAKGTTNPLGSPEEFRARYVDDSRAVRIRDGQREAFRRELSQHIVRVRRADANLVFPSRTVRTRLVTPSPVEQELIHSIGELFRDNESFLNALAQSSIGQALMSSPQALASQMENMAERGTVPKHLARTIVTRVDAAGRSGKIDGLLRLTEELRGQRPKDWRVVVFTSRKVTQDAIGRALEHAGVAVGYIRGGKPAENERAIGRFRQSPPGVHVLVSTDAGAEGVNLQVANVLVNYDLPWNPMVLEQRIGRVQRLASSHAEVMILNLVLAGSVEEKVVACLSEKLQAISESLGDIEGILETLNTQGKGEEALESMIRTLVVDSLKGIDTEVATQKALQSIEHGKRLFEEERETVERTMGDLSDMHRTGPSVPDIEPVEPSIEARDFVLRALRADGASVEPEDADTWVVRSPGLTAYRITFKERAYEEHPEGGYFGSTAPRLMLPGKRDFERMAQSWSEKAGSLVVDRSNPSDGTIEAALHGWAAGLDGFELAGWDVRGRAAVFSGTLLCRATVANGVDRLQTLVEVPVSIGGDGIVLDPIDDTEAPCDNPTDAAKLAEDLGARFMETAREEPNLRKFGEFYAQRLNEQLPGAGDERALRAMAERFSPETAGQAVAVSGVRSAQIHVDAQVRIDGNGPFTLAVVATPQAGHIDLSSEEAWGDCEHTGRQLPESVLGTCAATKKTAALWLLEPCRATGKLALPEAMERCEASGELALPEAMGCCEATGRRARRDLLVPSAVSGRLVLGEAAVRCEFAGGHMLEDESAVSELSGRRYRSDQGTRSVLSGKAGHRSEFVESVDPPGVIARNEAAQSDVSGRWAAVDRLVSSELGPSRRGLSGEVVRCVISGVAMLQDEAERSAVSGQLAAPDRLGACEMTGARVLPVELDVSDISGKRFRSDQVRLSVLSGRRGHPSEFVRAVDPAGWIATDEAQNSDMSGQVGAASRMVASAKPPHRRGLPDESVRCSVTEQILLLDETGVSVVSGTRVDTELLVASVASGRMALPEELVACEHTGVRLCPDELARCEITGQIVDARELAKSEDSGKQGLRSMMVCCACSGRLILPVESVRCEASGAIVSRRETTRCAISQRTASRAAMLASPATGSLCIDDEHTRAQVRSRTGLEQITVPCDWTGEDRFATETEVCTLSGYRVAPRWLNDRSELSAFRELLDGTVVDGQTSLDGKGLQWMARSHALLRHAQDGTLVVSPSGMCRVACVRTKTGLLGLGTAYAAVAVRVQGGHPELWGVPLVGRRESGTWQPRPS